MKLGRLRVAVAIYLNGGCEDYELLEEISLALDEDGGDDVAEFIAQLVVEHGDELEGIIDDRREARR